MEREYSPQEYFNAWEPQGGSYAKLSEEAPDLVTTVDVMLKQEAFIGQRSFIREIDGSIVLEPDVIFHINEDFKNKRQ